MKYRKFPQYKTGKKYRKTEYTKTELEKYGKVNVIPGALILTTEHEQFWMPLKRVEGKTNYYDWAEQRRMGFVQTVQQNPASRCPRGTRIQSYLFDVSKWNQRTAKQWLNGHGAKIPKVDKTEKYLRYRQELPGHFKKGSFRTITLEKSMGLKAVIGCPLKKWA